MEHNHAHRILCNEIGKLVRKRRQEVGMSQGELAEATGTNQSTISNIENGKNLPGLLFLYRVAAATDGYLLLPEIKNNN